MRSRLKWFEHLPLYGERILVTRPKHQADELARRVIALGGVPYILPAVEIGEPADWSVVDAAIGSLPDYRWLVFTSSNGVRAFFDRLQHLGRDLRAVGHLRFAAIGPKTAEALRRLRLEPDVVPEKYHSEDLAAAPIAAGAATAPIAATRALTNTTSWSREQ